MHFSLPNNRPLEQGSHWEESDCNLVHQTPKLPAIISSFLHQTQSYTGSQADLSCNTRGRKRFSERHIFQRSWGNCAILGVPVVALCWQIRSLWNLQMSRWDTSVSFSSTEIYADKIPCWHVNNTIWGKFLNRVVLWVRHTSLISLETWPQLGYTDLRRLSHLT